MRDIVKSGEYYKRARNWYTEMFIYPYVLRSEAFVVFVSIIIALSITAINIYVLFPLNRQVGYAILIEDTAEFSAKINNADYYGEDVYKSVSKIFLETYIDIRESYDYTSLANNMLFLQRTSTKPVYNKYNDYISIDNPDSPVLTLESYATKKVNIKSVTFTSKNNALVSFNTKAIKNTGKIISDQDWQAEITFVIDEVKSELKDNAPFNFTVSDYKVKLIRDNNAN